MNRTAPRFLSASTLTGDIVKTPQGDALGELKDIMIDTSSGTVAYGVLSFGGVLGMGEKLFAVPWSALKIDGEDKSFVLSASKDRLSNAPGFDKDHWPNFVDPAFVEELRGYYA